MSPEENKSLSSITRSANTHSTLLRSNVNMKSPQAFCITANLFACDTSNGATQSAAQPLRLQRHTDRER